jgi:signal transduction histidine kinase
MDRLMSRTTAEFASTRSVPPVLQSETGASVLVVDDHPPNLVAVEAILEPLGHRLVMVTSGEEALRHLLREDFALILLDVQMAKMDGIETAALIKGLERTRHIPIMFLTAVNRDAEHVFKGYRHGAVDYLLKPIEPELLRAKVTVFVDLYLRGEQIKRQAAQLIENAKLYEQERQARATAEAATRARENALAVVSHDLRNPLSTISMGATLMLEMMPDNGPSAPHRQTATKILRAAEQMATLLNDLLEVSRMEAGHLSLERSPQATEVLIGQALEMFQPLAAQRGQRVTVENSVADVLVLCDASRISQVFSNLLGNAIKFTRPGGTIALGARRAGEMVQFSVADDDAGIPAEQLPHIFERYWQARTTDRNGVGLGLAIAKGIVEAHGGTIRVESSSAGTTFTFTIPVAPPGPHVLKP